MKDALLPKLIVSLIGLGVLVVTLKAFLVVHIDMYQSYERDTFMYYESTMTHQDPAFYALLIPLFVFGLTSFLSCSRDVFKDRPLFNRWQVLSMFGILGVGGLLTVYMYSLK